MATTLTSSFVRAAKNVLPMPFTIAVLLSVFTMGLAMVVTRPLEPSGIPYPLQVLGFWEQGFWDLLAFAMQMMLMLVLGHVLALTRPADRLISSVLRLCTTTPRAVAVVTFLTMLVGLFNWGLGLIFGAVFARKVGDAAQQNGYALNYPMVGASGYAGMMVWHGGLSGSAPLKIAEANHFLIAQMGQIPLSQTVFSPMNLTITAALLLILPLAMYWLGRQVDPTPAVILKARLAEDASAASHAGEAGPITGAERLDTSPWMACGFGGLMLGVALYTAWTAPNPDSLGFLTPNYINFLLFGLGLVLYGSFKRYVAAIESAIAGSAGIMIQFPLYAGIAGIMMHSGLIAVFSDAIVQISTPITYPLYTLMSAGLVNMFVPSGGGQWAVQGPIIVEAATRLGTEMPKAVMALVYGDQLTNMLQPFWALPLLGITRLKAQEIIPFTFFLFLLGLTIFVVGLLLF